MFELSPEIVEGIIFVMEDQEGSWAIDLETGLARPLGEAFEEAEDGGGPELVEPPSWSSREGFKLMEDFAAALRGPSARRDLQSALSRGRGVFRAFKEALAAHPELERPFREHKHRAMVARIREWCDGLREARGLERLGSEPEDSADLAASDFGLSVGASESARPLILPLLDALEAEALEGLPLPIAVWEAEALRELIAGEGWVGVWVEDGEGGALAGAAGRREAGGGRGFSRIFMLYVRPEFRKVGLGRTLIERLGEELGGKEPMLLVLDTALLPQDYGERLTASGFETFGARSFRRN